MSSGKNQIMEYLDLIRKFHSNLPVIREWIEKTLAENLDHAVPVINLGFPRLGKVFPLNLLKSAKTVVVNGKVPFPPLSRMGLPELAQMEKIPKAGITYKDTVFVSHIQHSTESLLFHELVHVIQWDRLGVDDFLLAYGLGLMQSDYRNCPLEQMAYTLQEGFDRQSLPDSVVEFIRRETDAIWASVASLFQRYR
ncbi:MAG: hypothetical protein OS130_09645 [Thermodesulfobacteriota bacterium]|nr:MAG: hypothetical protein OS130_09645 [Thermodesulfobacteriota bacterium]